MNVAAESVTTPAPRSVLRLQGINKAFRGVTALEDVAFDVPEASLTVILGPAGAGKTTTLRVIAGLEQPDAGDVLLQGQQVNKWEPKDRNVAMIFDNLALYPNKSGFENLASPLRIAKVPYAEIKQRVESMAGTLKVGHTLGRLPKTMSGGERQRIALGRALIRTPSLFLLDEPLSSLDAMLRIELRAELKRLQRECGCTFLMATPDYTEALAIADTVILLREGKVVQMAAPQELYDLPADAQAATFVGAPQINLVPGCYDPETQALQLAGGFIPASDAFQTAGLEQEKPFDVGIRPENLCLAAPESASIKAEVADMEPLGLKSVLTVRNDAAELRVLLETVKAREVAIGQAVGLDVCSKENILAFDQTTGKRFVPAFTPPAP